MVKMVSNSASKGRKTADEIHKMPRVQFVSAASAVTSNYFAWFIGFLGLFNDLGELIKGDCLS